MGSRLLQPGEVNGRPSGARDASPLQESDSTAESEPSLRSQSSSPGPRSPSSKRARLKNITRKAKAKTKKILVPHDGKPNTPSRHDVLADGAAKEHFGDAVGRIDEDPAFNPRKTKRRQTAGPASPVHTTLDILATVKDTVKDTVKNPKEMIKAKATRTTADRLSNLHHPYMAHKTDLQFLRANDMLPSSGSSRDSSTSDVAALGEFCQEEVDKLEGHRESMRVAWTTSRHVRRVRVIPKKHLKFPDRSTFKQLDESGNYVRFKWEAWIGHMLIFYTQDFSAQYIDDFDSLPFDVDALRYHVERLVMASAPWQAWIMNVRRIYRWEDPRETGKWFVLYLVLWYTQHIMGFLYLYILYIVIYNRVYPSSVKVLQESMKRALDVRMEAYHFGELIDKHGREDWIGPMVDTMGPFIQLQLGDLANLLEILSNFYCWKSPKKTAGSLFFFFACLLMTLLTDMDYCMKIVWFIVGGSFFLCWPVSSLYPRYRYLVSPFRWILWDIPTYTEWSFQYLRRNAQISREKMIAQKVEEKTLHETLQPGLASYAGALHLPPHIITSNADGDLLDGSAHRRQEESDSDLDSDSSADYVSVSSSHSILDENDIISFRGEWKGTPGLLVVFSSGVRFVRRLPTKKECWRRDFLELAEMRKRTSNALPHALDLDQQLEFDFVDGETTGVKALRNRDEAFNTILGFSGLQWQSLQPRPTDSKRK